MQSVRHLGVCAAAAARLVAVGRFGKLPQLLESLIAAIHVAIAEAPRGRPEMQYSPA